MIPELGQFLLILALGAALAQGVLPLAGAQRGRADWMVLGRPLAWAQFALVLAAFVCLAASFVRHDFSVLYVASNSNSGLPLAYRIAAVWGGHEGSLLLWLLMLNVWTVAVASFSARLPAQFLARILGVLGLVAVGFLLFTLITSNPFERLLPAAADGRDLNPLLQDPGMVIHPPMLYMGYVGFSVAYAFAIAALLGGQLDAAWARWTRPWTTAAWIFLTFGIGLGSWWAYNELGWGGWWFWDPVENASFMPWLVGTALIHSLAVTEKRGGFKVWTVLLAIVAFSLSLLGTFLVRSGVLTSVHAFATDPKRGLFILAFLVIAIGASLGIDLAERLRPVGQRSSLAGVWARARLLPLAMIGMMVAHAGVAAFAFGVAMVKTYEIERDVKMGPDSSTELGGYTFRMLSLREVQGPNYAAAQGQIELSRGGRVIALLLPEKRIYRVQSNPMTEAAVDSNLLRDLYVSMGEQLPSGEWIVRVQVKPFINWIWIGCLVMMLGGILAACDPRYRQRRTKAAELPAAAIGAAP